VLDLAVLARVNSPSFGGNPLRFGVLLSSAFTAGLLVGRHLQNLVSPGGLVPKGALGGKGDGRDAAMRPGSAPVPAREEENEAALAVGERSPSCSDPVVLVCVARSQADFAAPGWVQPSEEHGHLRARGCCPPGARQTTPVGSAPPRVTRGRAWPSPGRTGWAPGVVVYI